MIILDELKGVIPSLQKTLHEASKSLRPDELRDKLHLLEEELVKPDFWNDQAKAQKVTKEKRALRIL